MSPEPRPKKNDFLLRSGKILEKSEFRVWGVWGPGGGHFYCNFLGFNKSPIRFSINNKVAGGRQTIGGLSGGEDRGSPQLHFGFSEPGVNLERSVLTFWSVTSGRDHIEIKWASDQYSVGAGRDRSRT